MCGFVGIGFGKYVILNVNKDDKKKISVYCNHVMGNNAFLDFFFTIC